MDLARARDVASRDRVEWRKHRLTGLLLRNIPQMVVLQVIMTGEVIEEYPRDRPFPSCLVLGWVNGKPYHIVVSLDEDTDILYVVTVYEPALDKFQADFRTRR